MKEKILNIISGVTGNDRECILENMHLTDHLYLDSLDLVEIQFAIEEQLLDNNDIPADEADAWETVQDIISSAEKILSRTSTTFHVCIDMRQALRRGDHHLNGILSDDNDKELDAAEVRAVFKAELAKGYSYFCGCDNRNDEGRCAGHRKWMHNE